MNHGEAREASRMLASMGCQVTGPYRVSEDARPEAAMIFTCDVISSTENHMWRRIDELYSSCGKVIVAGCLAALAGQELRMRFPGVHLIDSMGLPSLRSSIERMFEPCTGGSSSGLQRIQTTRIDTIVPVSTGCAGNCSYCITKLARGRIRSYPVETVLEAVRRGVGSGRIEILLTSQDTAAYGMDGRDENIGSLLRAITDGITGNYRIRVGMMNPVLAGRIMDHILEGYDNLRVFRFFHIPVQSGSDPILRRMGRGYSVDDFRSMVAKIRDRFPMATISTDLIAGFPGETEEDHVRSMELLRWLRPDILNITRFSRRPETAANMMTDQVKGAVIKDRSREMTAIHSEMQADILERRLGHHPSCLVTEVGKGRTMMARDVNYTPIVIEAGREILGRSVDIDTSETGPSYLKGGRDWKP